MKGLLRERKDSKVSNTTHKSTTSTIHGVVQISRYSTKPGYAQYTYRSHPRRNMVVKCRVQRQAKKRVSTNLSSTLDATYFSTRPLKAGASLDVQGCPADRRSLQRAWEALRAATISRLYHIYESGGSFRASGMSWSSHVEESIDGYDERLC